MFICIVTFFHSCILFHCIPPHLPLPQPFPSCRSTLFVYLACLPNLPFFLFWLLHFTPTLSPHCPLFFCLIHFTHKWVLTYLHTPWCRVLLEKLTGLQLVNKFPAFHGTWRFITALASVRHLSLSWASPIQSIYTSHRLEMHPNIIHPSMPRSPQRSLSLRFPHQHPICPPLLTHMRHMPSPSHSSRFYHPHNISTNHLAPRYAISSIPPLPRPP